MCCCYIVEFFNMEYYVIYDFGRICIRKSIGGLNKIEEFFCFNELLFLFC